MEYIFFGTNLNETVGSLFIQVWNKELSTAFLANLNKNKEENNNGEYL